VSGKPVNYVSVVSLMTMGIFTTEAILYIVFNKYVVHANIYMSLLDPTV
jgi:hypothetical protein